MQADEMVRRSDLLRKQSTLDVVTVLWYGIVAITAMAMGMFGHSIVLIGFGADSIIYTVSALLVVLRFRGKLAGEKAGDGQASAERRLFFVLGVLFFLLGLYILNEAGSRLFYREHPDSLIPGLILSIAAFFGAAVLSVLKLLTARDLDSKPLRNEAKEDSLRCYLPIVLFLGIWLPLRHGFWWADPVASLLMIPFILREGWKAIEDSKRSLPGRQAIKSLSQ